MIPAPNCIKELTAFKFLANIKLIMAEIPSLISTSRVSCASPLLATLHNG